jgi:hypothetical protein
MTRFPDRPEHYPVSRGGDIPRGQIKVVPLVPAGGRSSAGHPMTREGDAVDLEETLAKIVELSQEELHIVRKRGEEKTPARDHGQDFHEMQQAADRLDHYAHLLRRLHDNELGQNWRHESRSDTARGS